MIQSDPLSEAEFPEWTQLNPSDPLWETEWIEPSKPEGIWANQSDPPGENKRELYKSLSTHLSQRESEWFPWVNLKEPNKSNWTQVNPSDPLSEAK